ncbi:hypothetical protein [Streptomyces finlayi]|nr:hypothetical protein [Streptomyces finlayi]
MYRKSAVICLTQAKSTKVPALSTLVLVALSALTSGAGLRTSANA